MKKSKNIVFLFFLFSYSLLWTLDCYLEVNSSKKIEWTVKTENQKELDSEFYWVCKTEPWSKTKKEYFVSRRPKVIMDTFYTTAIYLQKYCPPPEC
ncbi:hypothetical protein [Flavobacterium sp.]|uniref:hypothetical protein n=1 Tax=Flavobacterium sp. TaxID=239 RepID=UPI002614A71B|nr:hypothetical protein [Flavobacterium sp.]